MSNDAKPRVLLLDAHLRHSLAIARSLGRHGIPVIAAASERRFPARYSRHVERCVVLAAGEGREGLEALTATIERERIGVVIAGGVSGNALLCRYREELEPLVRAPFNQYAEFELMSNKQATVELAERLGVPHPATAQLRNADEAKEVAARIGFPMVFKSPVDQGTVRYPRDVEQLERFAEEFGRHHSDLIDGGIYPMVQEYVDGVGHGFYALADHGHVRAYFMHRRLHEVPPSGGPSAMAMSYRDLRLLELGERFFSATGWHGVAMVEFKRRRHDGSYYVLEVNPKFWGSLDLSISAGVDFPFLLYQMLIGEPVDVEPGAYRDDAIFRWLTMDLAHAAATRSFRGYLRAFSDSRIADDVDRTDVLPTAVLFVKGLGRVAAPALHRSGDRRRSNPIALRAFYLAKPLIPRPAQVAARRIRARRIWSRLERDGRCQIPSEPLHYPWPDGVRACALLTHDVETAVGQRNIEALLKIEDEYELRSCWNFVVRRYQVDTALIADLRRSGHEIGIHGVYHDGKKFESESRFRERLAIMEDAGRAWGADGFRSPSLIYDPTLLKTLPFAWDSSMPAWDPFQPKRGDCYKYIPFPLSDQCIELPVTVWQDFTLFEELRMRDIDVWRQQIDAIYAIGGLITVIVHPDYMVAPHRLDHYRALLDYLLEKDGVWITRPAEVAAWEHQRPHWRV